MTAIELNRVTKTYTPGGQKVYALKEVDLAIRRGAMTVILGPSGSGKTTVLNLIGGMDVPTSGSVSAFGQDLTGLNDAELTRYRREHVGFVFQHYNLIPNLTAEENVGIGSQYADSPIPPADALRSVGLEQRQGSFPFELSGGQMQRVAVARALAKRPDVLLCDEPTGALDSGTGKAVIELLRGVADQSETAVVVVTHNAAIAAVADDVIRMHDGKIADEVRRQQPVSAEEIAW